MFTRLLKAPNQSFFLFGPRGTGKSTFLKKIYPKAVFYDLLLTDEMRRFSQRPQVLVDETAHLKAGDWVVIDEIQKVPGLLDSVHYLIEEKKVNFALSGSSARKLKRGHANLLAGRALVRNFFPLTYKEVNHQIDLHKVLRFGMLPIAFQSNNPEEYLKSYVDTYLKEEIKEEALTRNLGGFIRFLEIAARINGQVTNVSNIARDAQVARQTVQGYFEILVDTLMGYWLNAWKLKPGVKQVMHPKFYFFDTGVCRALSGRGAYPVQPEEQGFLLETYLIGEVRAYLDYQKKYYPLYFWSSPDEVEVDLLLETTQGLVAFEFKSGSQWPKSFNRGLLRIKDELKLSNNQLWGVFAGPRNLIVEDIQVLTVTNFLNKLWAGEIIN